MARYPPVIVAHQNLAVAGERDRLDRHRGLFLDFADQRFGQCLAGLDHAARHGPDAERGAARAPRDQHAPVTDDGGADGKEGTVGIGAEVGCGAHRLNIASIAACGTLSRLLKPGAVPLIRRKRVTIGFSTVADRWARARDLAVAGLAEIASRVPTAAYS